MANFVRKNLNPDGVYLLAYKTGINPDTGMPEIRKEIKIEGRTVYSTDDKELIKVLRNDPEIIEYDKKTQIEMDEEE